jgi:CRISP-associated protein Cas1
LCLDLAPGQTARAKYQIALHLTRAARGGKIPLMGRGSVCDPFDAAAIAERIAAGETTGADAYRRYAASAARPCARSTFAQRLSLARTRAGGLSAPPVEKRSPGRPPARALSPLDMGGPVLVIGPDAALRVRGGALDVEHGLKPDRERLRIDVDEPKPAAILFDAHGEFLTGEAIRWCARYAIPLILPDGPGRAILFQESALETADAGRGLNDKHAGRIRDVAPSLIRAQVLADPVRVARAIVRAKLAASAARAQVDRSKWSLSLERARSVAEIVTIEARIAASYWRAFRDFGLRERRNGNLPRSWLRFANRNKGARFLGARHASHPINAMLNYAYVVEAGRLARALTAIGLALPIGFLHSDKKGRNSLVWDAIEPLRPEIDARVFKFISSREFGRSDFPQAGRNAHRIDRAIIAELLRNAILPWERIEGAARWMARTIADGAKLPGSGLTKISIFK